MLTQNLLKELLHYNPLTGLFTWLQRSEFDCHERSWNTKWGGKIAGSLDTHGHRQIRIQGKRHSAHRVAWLYVTGEWPEDEIDHADLNRDNNSFANLREASRSENVRNRGAHRNNSSGFKGVYWRKDTEKWCAEINRQRLGYFNTPEEAHAAYCEAATRLHGEFARAA